MKKRLPLLIPNKSSTANNLIALSKLQEYSKNKRCVCYFNLPFQDDAEIVNVRELSGYVTHLWTLVESRWTPEKEAPYYGDELIPNNVVGDIWRDYEFDSPATIVLPTRKSRSVSRDLKNTQPREHCSKCLSHEHIQCRRCKDHRFVVI